MSKNLVIIIAIVLIAFGGTAAYIGLRQMPSQAGAEQGGKKMGNGQTVAAPRRSVPIAHIDTSNWKTYRNEKYGFSFKYPKEWKIKTSVEEGETGIVLNPPGNFSPVSFLVIDNPKCTPIDKYLPSYYFDPQSDFSVKYNNGKLFYSFRPYISYAGKRYGMFVTDKYFLEATNFDDTVVSTFRFERR